MSQNFWKTKNLTKEIILKLAEVGMFTVAATSPYFLHKIVRQYLNKTAKEARKRAAERIRELEKRKIIDIRESRDGMVRVTLTHQGKNLVREYKLDELKIKKPPRWDKKWRLIIYDIPHYQKKARDAFRQKLNQLGLYPLQKSVWVSAYDCLAELEFLAGVFSIDFDNIIYLTVYSIPNEKKLKDWFDLND